MICVFPADAEDFTGNGAGMLAPTKCEVSETLNGEYELVMEHPLDDGHKWQRLQEGRILRVPVPAAATPQVDLVSQESYQVYKTNAKNRPLRAKAKSNGKVLAKYKKGKKVIILNKGATWYEVTGPDGKHGYMNKAHLTYVETKYRKAEATGEVIEPTLLRDQPFRIYRIVPDLEKVTVYARHLFYDLLDNMIKSLKPAETMAGSTVVQQLSAGALTEHEFDFYSDLTSTAKEIEWEAINPLEALMGDEGLLAKYNGELARDWYDVYVVQRVGVDTDIQIREGKNLLGVSYDVDTTDVVTRIMPTGEDKDGNTVDWSTWHSTSPVSARPPYDDLEPRFQATVLYNGAEWKGGVMECTPTGNYGRYMKYRADSYPNGRTVTGYYLKKFLQTTTDEEFNSMIISNGKRGDATWVELRLAEVYLNRAEALYHTGGDALADVNAVRARVGLPAKTSVSGDALFDLIRRERTIELSYEGHLWWDMRRWKLADTEYNNYRCHGIKPEGSPGSYTFEYVEVDDEDRKFPARLYVLPIPTSETNNNSAIKQYQAWL